MVLVTGKSSDLVGYLCHVYGVLGAQIQPELLKVEVLFQRCRQDYGFQWSGCCCSEWCGLYLGLYSLLVLQGRAGGNFTIAVEFHQSWG